MEKVNGYVKKAIVLVLAIALALSVGFFGLFNYSKAETIEEEKQLKIESITDFLSDGQEVESERVMTDFGGNVFRLYELSPAGYAIYSEKYGARIFIEGSYKIHSPYYELVDQEIYYLGTGEYFYVSDGQIINIFTQETENDLRRATYELAEEKYYITPEPDVMPLATYPAENNPDPDNTTSYRGFTVISNYEYFTKLERFPDNNDGTCALVAICIYLGYLYNYVDTGFITNSSYLWVGNEDSPTGPSNELHNYLFENCLATILGLEPGDLFGRIDGYPIADKEIKQVMDKYMKANCSYDINNNFEHVNGSVFYTHANPRRHINSGNPSLIVMTKYTASVSLSKPNNKYHTVVAYGYNKSADTFLVHMGWDAWTKDYTEVIVSNVTINGYYTLYKKG